MLMTFDGSVQTMETAGFAVASPYIDPGLAEEIHARTFTPDLEYRRDAKGELGIVYACWDDPAIDEIVDNVTSEFHDAGYHGWEPNNITLRDTVRGFEEHPDDPWFIWGSAMVYLTGTTVMRVTNSLDPSIRAVETLTAGDRLLMRQAGDPPHHQGPRGLDRRTRHGANLDRVNTFGSHRSFLYIAYINHDL